MEHALSGGVGNQLHPHTAQNPGVAKTSWYSNLECRMETK